VEVFGIAVLVVAMLPAVVMSFSLDGPSERLLVMEREVYWMYS
jgi:hypothetical protein